MDVKTNSILPRAQLLIVTGIVPDSIFTLSPSMAVSRLPEDGASLSGLLDILWCLL